jgi:hypothetical protein
MNFQRFLNFLRQIFCYVAKRPYLCQRYPENNLFTLMELIPIEDLERWPVKVIAFFMPYNFHSLIVILLSSVERRKIV